MNAPAAPATTKAKIAAHLTEHGHTWTILLAVALICLYFAKATPPSSSSTDSFGRVVLYFVSAVGLPSGLLALVFMACLNSTDFGKLDKLQHFILLGIGLSTLAAATVVLDAYGIGPLSKKEQLGPQVGTGSGRPAVIASAKTDLGTDVQPASDLQDMWVFLSPTKSSAR